MRTLTSSNSTMTLTIPGLFPAPRNIEGYAVDDVFMADAIETAQTMMGVDGKMSFGYTPAVKPFTITLMPTSPSMALFELWQQSMETLREALPATALVLAVPGMERTYTFTKGVLVNYKPLPDGKKLLQQVQFVTHWERIVYAPFAV